MVKELKYKTIFSSTIKCLINDEKDKILSLASAEQLKGLIPDEVKGEKNIDLLPISAPLCNVGRANLNGDLIDKPTATAIYKSFINRGLNIEHKRTTYIGHIISAGFSEYQTNKPLTLEAIKDKDIFDISIAGVLYKIANPSLMDFVEDCSNPSSVNHDKCSLSWEISFASYKILVGSRNINEGKIIDSSEKDNFEKYDKFLKCNGGTGKDDKNNEVYRLVCGEEVYPLGAAITESPAGFIRGLYVENGQKEETINAQIDEITNKIKDSILETIRNEIKQPDKEELSLAKDKENNAKDKENISQLEKPDVNQNSRKNITNMKITKLQDITDESLKQISASDMNTFINDELQKVSEKYVAEKNAKETLEKNHKALEAKHLELETQTNKIKADLDKIQSDVAAKEKTEKFNQRMAHFDETYELEKEDSEIIAKKLGKVDSDEAYAELEKELKVLLKHKNKEVIKAAKDKELENKDDKDKNKETKGSTETVKGALDNLEVDKTKGNLPNSTTVEPKTLTEKYAKAFDTVEGFEYGNKRDKRKIFA